MKRRAARETAHLHIIAESNGAATSKVLAARKGEPAPIATGVLNLARPKDRAQFVAQLPAEYHAEAEDALLGLCGDTLDDVSKAPAEKVGQGTPVAFPDDEPWPDPVDGAALLDAIARLYRKYLIMQPGCVERLALWCLFAHGFDCFDVSPILALLSSEKRSGKTLGLTLLAEVAPRALPTSNLSPAALFRCVEKYRPALLADEAETFIRLSDELRGVYNSGHTRRFAFAMRTVGDDHEPRLFSTWCPKALALIGHLPPTIEDRSIIVAMKRRKPTEAIARLRMAALRVEAAPLRRQAARWVRDHEAALRAADPAMPDFLNDRAALNWSPLLAIADLAGGDWPRRAREACQADQERGDDAPSFAQRLLRDIQAVAFRGDEQHVTSEDLCRRLIAIEEAPWGAMKQRNAPDAPITPRKLAELLKKFDVHPKTIRTGDATPRGYLLRDFSDAFARYTPSTPPAEVKHPQHDCGTTTYASSASETDDEMLRIGTGANSLRDNDVADVSLLQGGTDVFSRETAPVSITDPGYWAALDAELHQAGLLDQPGDVP